MSSGGLTTLEHCMSLNRITQLCERIERGYEAGKSGLDEGKVDHVLELSNNARAVADALRELATARELLGGLCDENQFDFTHTEVDSFYDLKVKCRDYVRQHLPDHARGLTGG